MGTIICQSCDSTIAHFEDEKVSILYSHSQKCPSCNATAAEEN
ncbi:GapA-binding peptide SR1P [Peribacillus asahii]|uniref:GapA-binding peptide SR1P n=1 Tax=Peribacillus asahii TaxID=228899 RepID=A0A398BFZ8_9BACI|nr:GapA-binding peptide SR1P [Peribacillus asahii]RID87638.1 GapA-binding peptide SR1P [Peribacillus asahii]